MIRAPSRCLRPPRKPRPLLGSYYRRWHGGMYTGLGNMWGVANVQSFENYSSLANNGQNARAGIPRPPNDNSISNVSEGEQQGDLLQELGSEPNRLQYPHAVQRFHVHQLDRKRARDNARGRSRNSSAVSPGLFSDVLRFCRCELSWASTEDAGELVGYTEVADSSFVAFQRADRPRKRPHDGRWRIPTPRNVDCVAQRFIRPTNSAN